MGAQQVTFRRVSRDTMRSDTHELWRYEAHDEPVRYILSRLVRGKREIVWNFPSADEAKAYAAKDYARHADLWRDAA
jgi:hypothetical protein